jgi:uncharacterized integral membrane protein (TIGR00698 family)
MSLQQSTTIRVEHTAPSGTGVTSCLQRYAPGTFLCVAITLAAYALQVAEQHLFGRAWLEALVLAILLGTALRSVWTPSARWLPGINLSAKTLLEIAIVLLGASLSLQTLSAAGVGLFLGIAAVVFVAIAVGYTVARSLGLGHRLALLVACGNAICGNSAIAAVAPIIDAHSDDVAASIAFTAVLGVVVVLGLPLLAPLLQLSALQYGTLAGLTVYAVPQVLAATVPVSAVSANFGMVVKLTRVLMLGPVILALSVRSRVQGSAAGQDRATSASRTAAAWHKLLPWFIVGFLLMLAARSANLIPASALQPASDTASALTIVSMAALGVGVDVRSVVKAGPRVTLAVVVSLVALMAISIGLIQLLHIT